MHQLMVLVYIDIKLLTLRLIERCKLKLCVMNSFINMKGCSSNNINRNCSSGLISNEEIRTYM